MWYYTIKQKRGVPKLTRDSLLPYAPYWLSWAA